MAESEIKFIDCFRYDVRSRSAICRISTDGKKCNTKITNNHHGNKMRHLKSLHRHIYDGLKKTKRRKKVRNFCGQITVKIHMGAIYAAFVELVSTNGRPFCIVDDSGMRIILEPILDAIYDMTGEKVCLNCAVIKDKVNLTYKYVRNEIVKAIEKKPLALMTDISTKHNYSILGINIRYCDDDLAIFTRTIGMISLTNSHTAENLYKAIINVLNEYQIKANQIFSYTTDNAGNIVNVVDFLNDNFETYMIEEAPDVFADLSNAMYGELLDRIQPDFEREYPFIEPVACGAHTTQLAVKDSLKEESYANEIEFVKERVKILRTPTMATLLRSKNLKQAVIDHEIRWNYTYLMVIYSHFI